MGIAGDQSNILSAPTPPATEPPPEEYTTGGKTIAQVQADVTGGVVTAAAAKASEETQPVPRVTLLTWLDEQIAAA